MYVVLVLRRIREIFDFAPLILSIDGKMVSWQHWGVFPICEIHIFFLATMIELARRSTRICTIIAGHFVLFAFT
jgi:hypothetical protein